MSIGTAIGLTGVAAGLATAGTISAGVGAAGAIGSSLIQSNSASDAENLQSQEAANSLNLEQSEFNQEQQNEQPFLNAAYPALSQLSAGTAPGGSLVAPYPGTFNPGTFTAPTGLTEQNDPGFQARLQLGQQALEATDAANGITGGGAEQAAEQYGQTFATNDYQNVYSNALNAYNANYQSGLGAFNTNYNVYANNQANTFNRLATLAGAGQTAAGQVNEAGQTATAGQVATNTNLANQNTNLITSQGATLAAGLGGVGTSVSGAANTFANQQLLQQLLSQNSNNSGYYTPAGSANGSQLTQLGTFPPGSAGTN